MTRREVTALIFVSLVSVGAAFAIWALSRQNDNKLVAAQIASCERVNLLRRQFNTHSAVVQKFTREVIAAEARYLTSPTRPPGDELPPAGFRHPHARIPNSELPERELSRAILVAFAGLGKGSGHIDLVDCHAAIAGES